ncbi:hypothetical protein ACFX2C_040817 [Malus domestica]
MGCSRRWCLIRQRPNQVARRADSAPNNHSGELSGSSESSPTATSQQPKCPEQLERSDSLLAKQKWCPYPPQRLRRSRRDQ